MLCLMVSQLLASPQFVAFVTGLILTVLWSAVGKVGRFLEAQGDTRGIVALVVIGKQLEALGYDGDKLKGKPGAPEPGATITIGTVTNMVASDVAGTVEKAVNDALAKASK
jgi:hypothetical protein